MRKKFAPAVFFRDGILSLVGYTFERARQWHDTGSMTFLAEGSSLKDESNVLAKIAVTQSNGSMCLEREAHILGRLATAAEKGFRHALRMIDFFTIPKDSGDVVVLLLVHPGLNMLGRYLPPAKINDLLLPDASRIRPQSTHGDAYMMDIEEPNLLDEVGGFDIMDLATFLEFAIQATHCLEAMHRAGVVHREVRANAFHHNSHSGLVRFVHFGNRAISLESFGSPSSLVLNAIHESEKVKVKEALCYLAPEQTGSIETMTQDHRTDLYSLGILFWTLLVGRGQMPFEGGPIELLHSIVQKRPMPVHEVRRDVPQVLASIIDKLLVKSPDMRYQSASGLKADLMECQRRLLATVSSTSEESTELIPPFEIATQDRFMDFTIPLTLFGREKELETVRNVIRNCTASFSVDMSASSVIRSSGSSGELGEDQPHSDSAQSSVGSESPMEDISMGMQPPSAVAPSSAGSASGTIDSLRRVALQSKSRTARTHAVIVVGPPGVGKSSIILANQAKWRAHGLWGHAKFINADSSGPFSTLLSCLAAVLRQLMVFHTDLQRFVIALKEKLGPQMQNIPLLYDGTPELRDVLALFDIEVATPKEHLSTRELRARFQTLVQSVFAVIAETRLFALFLDDLQEADESTLDLVEALINSKCRMLIFATIRSSDQTVVDRVHSMFTGRSRPTWINLESLPYSAIGSMVAKALHRPKEDCASLSRLVYDSSSGNAFSARNILTTLQRQHHIKFNEEQNCWDFDIAAAEESLGSKKISDPTDLSFLISNLRELPEDARKYLRWAAMFGETFNMTEIAQLIDGEDNSGSSGDEESEERSMRDAVPVSNASVSMRGLQVAVEQGWIIQRARDMCSFAHDRYRQAAQAEVASLPEGAAAKMSLRIILMMLNDGPDIYRIAEHAVNCLPLLRDHPRHEEFLDVLIEAGESAWARGAHELAMRSFVNARTLLRKNAWATKPDQTFNLMRRLAALSSWAGDYDQSEALLQECLLHVEAPEDRGLLLWQRSRNNWLCNRFSEALNDTLMALKILGVDIMSSPSRRDADRLFDQVHNEILTVGFDEILSIPRTTDSRTELAVALLNDAGINAYWSPSPFAIEVIGCMTIRLALRSGMSPGTATGFFWALGAAAERKDLYRLSVDLAQVALKIADRHGGSGDKCRAHLLYGSMVAGYDNVHIRANLERMQIAMQYGHSAGDRVYTSFAAIHLVLTRLFVCEHLSELVGAAEECYTDVQHWAPKGPATALAMANLNCIRAIAGLTNATSAATAFDTESFVESEYYTHIHATSGNLPLALNWYDSMKIVGLFSLGYVAEAAKLGFDLYPIREKHPNHRHVRYGLFFHSLALIACLRTGLPESVHRQYLDQVHKNQSYISRWRSPSPVNNSTWVALVDAELASLTDSPEALKLYDAAVRLAVSNDWINEEGWALYLQGSHFIRQGVEGLGSELQRRGISRHAQWGAKGIVNYLNSTLGTNSQGPPTRAILYCDAAVQTDSISLGIGSMQASPSERQQSELGADDLWAILKSSQDISSDINLSSALQRLTEIATDISGSQNTCVVIAREAGDYTLATSLTIPGPCQVYDNPRSIRTLSDPLQKAIIEQTLNTKEPFFCDDASLDPKFSAEAAQSTHRSIICLPIRSNRGQTFGCLSFQSKYPFSLSIFTKLTLLCQQASISVANALLFRSVQAGTRENLKMIAAQREALEAARKSREDALTATKIKGNFLASMSHELRTPFSSFYGLLDLLSGTELDPGQSEIVQTAKQSCELLLRIIDSILDYSKLEASAVKLEPSGFLVESILADCMELLLPMAAQKLDLTFNIEPNVPAWVFSDYPRIRQVLMNLIGNAVKFTASGSVRVLCSVDSNTAAPEDVRLRFAIQDTGIGLSPKDADLLFVPFQQADNSSTRRFGGTGLGLSISSQLVKLMGGVIGVKSDLNVGSTFWFTLPVKVYDAEESRKFLADLESVRSALLHPRPMEILVCSASEYTLAFLKTILDGFRVTLTSNLADAEARLRAYGASRQPLDFVILDDQSETHADEMATFLRSLGVTSLHGQETKIIHLYTPTMTRSSHSIFSSSTPSVVKMTKPPRKARLLQTLAELKDLTHAMPAASSFSHIGKAMENIETARRTLFGNVLVAEDNKIAQDLLVKQLQKQDLNVVATSDGNEALAEWQKHEPGYFSVALFDHHMPVCDGVEATKRLRHLEQKRKVPVSLPVIALSADCQESTKQLCLSAGMNAFFSKPLKKSDLISLLSMFGAPPA
uniref:Histidine kinase n=1 Tax=Mycena chlorophos TaxID=658473 RepID=A0ABQ0M2I0_MYCCL|nr:histidine kinase [Mycena chlorophos]